MSICINTIKSKQSIINQLSQWHVTCFGHMVTLSWTSIKLEWWILNNCVRLVESMCHDVVMARKFSLWNILPTTCNDERNLIYSKRHTHICLYEYLLYMCTLYIFITHIYIYSFSFLTDVLRYYGGTVKWIQLNYTIW